MADRHIVNIAVSRCGPAIGLGPFGPHRHIKDRFRDYSDFAYDEATTFNDGDTTVPPDNLNIDDRLCVTAFRTHGEAIASRVLATRRSQIEARDRQDLVYWQQESVFGTVASLDTDNRRIEQRTPGGSDVSIDIAE